LYSEYRGNKLQALTKMANKLRYGATIFAIVFTMDREMDYWVSFSFTYPSSLHLKVKSMKKNRSHMIVSM